MSKNKSSVAIHWFRRDLRITDNTALTAAASAAAFVIPVYIFSKWEKDHLWTGSKRQQFLCDCLKSLEGNIFSIGGQLIFRQGDAIEELIELAKETNATAIYTNRNPDLYGRSIEIELEKALRAEGIEFHLFKDTALHEKDELLTQANLPYRVFTPYSRKWHSAPKVLPQRTLKQLSTPKDIPSLKHPTLHTWKLKETEHSIFEGGEKAARKRMQQSLQRIKTYDATRDIPSIETGTSRLSQDLRFGCISIRELHAKVQKSFPKSNTAEGKNAFKYLNELAWREFYFQILFHFPEVLELEFNPDWRGLPWDEPGEQLESWKNGETGFPIIDAGIRELRETGFMHNRVRMIVAMFLTKDLHIDWRLGEQFFMQHLVDGEIASNNGGWQWSAGTGADAAPYFRIQNPWTQTKRYDPQGLYIKKWLPDLNEADPRLFHAQPKIGESVYIGYPAPIVDHSEERLRTLDIFKKHKERTK